MHTYGSYSTGLDAPCSDIDLLVRTCVGIHNTFSLKTSFRLKVFKPNNLLLCSSSLLFSSANLYARINTYYVNSGVHCTWCHINPGAHAGHGSGQAQQRVCERWCGRAAALRRSYVAGEMGGDRAGGGAHCWGLVVLE